MPPHEIVGLTTSEHYVQPYDMFLFFVFFCYSYSYLSNSHIMMLMFTINISTKIVDRPLLNVSLFKTIKLMRYIYK